MTILEAVQGDITTMRIDAIVNAANPSLLGGGGPARHIIHTVGPVWGEGNAGEAELLRRCYESCLALARAHDLPIDLVRFVCFSARDLSIYQEVLRPVTAR